MSGNSTVITSEVSKVIIFYTSKVVYFNAIDAIIKEYIFRDYQFVITLVIFFLIE